MNMARWSWNEHKNRQWWNKRWNRRWNGHIRKGEAPLLLKLTQIKWTLLKFSKNQLRLNEHCQKWVKIKVIYLYHISISYINEIDQIWNIHAICKPDHQKSITEPEIYMAAIYRLFEPCVSRVFHRFQVIISPVGVMDSNNYITPPRLGVGVTKQSSAIFLIFQYFHKHMVASEYHIYIWQVSLHLSCSDTCQIWMWFKEANRKIENFCWRRN